jgi:hypothetical protein
MRSLSVEIILITQSRCLFGLCKSFFLMILHQDAFIISYSLSKTFTHDFWHSTEGCLVDIAASVPLIRPLFTRSGITETPTYEMRDFSGHKGLSSNSRAFATRSMGAVKLNDSGSEDGILPMHGTHGAIMKQTSYVVEYDVEKQSSDVRTNSYQS